MLAKLTLGEVLTIALVLIGIGALCVQRDTEERDLRAYVTAGETKIIPTTNSQDGDLHWVMTPEWKNVGNTPTRSAKVSIQCFTIDAAGKTIDEHAPSSRYRDLGPDKTGLAGGCTLTPKEMLSNKAAGKKNAVYSAVDYKDVFGTDHHSEQCVVLTPISDADVADPAFQHTFSLCADRNCEDEECETVHRVGQIAETKRATMINTSDWIAILALIVASGALALELRRWFDSKPRLLLSVMGDAKTFPHDDGAEKFAITVINRGSEPTVLSHMVAYTFPTWWRRRRFRPSATWFIPERTIPFELGVNKHWVGIGPYDANLRAARDRGELYVGVVATHSDKNFLIKVPSTKKSAVPVPAKS